MILPVILSGGIGSRLWPLSRENHPKPFIKLSDGQSLIQKAYLRAVNLDKCQEIVTVTNRDLFFYTKDEFEEVSSQKIQYTFLLEPLSRNSAAAIALAAHYANLQYGSDCTLLIMPADHIIDNYVNFEKCVNESVNLASQGKLVTFGIKPHAPHPGFGYIEAYENEVKRFVEKPNLKCAQEFLLSGNYFWNSGIFCMNSGVFIEELKSLCPEIYKHSYECFSKAKYSSGSNYTQYEIQRDLFSSIQDISIDYALFEKSNKISMVSCDFGWSDVGSWNDLGNLYPVDNSNNNVKGNVLLEDTQNCIIHSNEKLIATIGVENLIIAEVKDSLLIASKNRSQDVRTIVSKLKKENLPIIHRSWGAYQVLQENIGFRVKRIKVKPGASLSLQSHKHGSEHWVVISGTALLINDEEIIKLEKNQSTYIPIGNKRRLENYGNDILVMIKIHCGDYLYEDDNIGEENDFIEML
jgi:mannose-1-phosphate guanylyltransferase / mannose-6-phosphate isomerase